MKDNFKDGEQKILNQLPKAIDSVKSHFTGIYENVAQESKIDDVNASSLEYKDDGDVNTNTNANTNANANNLGRARILTKDSYKAPVLEEPETLNERSKDSFDFHYFPFDDGRSDSKGVSFVLILVALIALVAIVAIVTMSVLKMIYG